MLIVRGDPTPEETAALVAVLVRLRSLHPHREPASAATRQRTEAWRRSEPEDSTPRWRDWPSGWREVAPAARRPARRSDRSWDRRVG